MELRHLATLRAIVKSGTFLRAAQALNYSQSTVTQHVQQLEAELGVPLFARRGKRATLTDAGRLLSQRAGPLLDEVTSLAQLMAELAGGDAGQVRIGAIEPAATRRVLPVLARFSAERPRVRVVFDIGGTRALITMIASGDLDIAVCSPPPAGPGLTFEPLFVEKMALLLPKRHPLAGARTIDIDRLARHRILLTEPTCAYRQATEQHLMPHGANPYSGIEITSIEALKWAVQSGMGVAVVPVSSVTPPPRGTILRDVADLDLGLPVGLLSRRDGLPPSRALEALVAALREGLGG
jgi:DNA-binding transcriptional LysR family regulator